MSAMGAEFERELLAIFAQEGVELIEGMEQELLAIEYADQPRRDQGMGVVRRNLHTLKGAAGALGITPIVRICHELEEATAPEALVVNEAFFEAFYQAIAFMYAHVRGEECQPLDDLLGLLQQRFGGASASAPIVEESKEPTQRAVSLPQLAVIRVASQKIDELQAVAGELVVLNLQQAQGQRQIEELRDRLAALLSQCRLATSQRSAGESWQSRQEHKQLAQMTQRLKDAYQQSYDLARWTLSHSGQLTLLSNALDEGLQKIRMQPLGPFFDSYAPALRQAARQEDKLARFESSGREIEVDRAVLERLREPLLHLVRNAVAHGIEAPQERRRLGKQPEGSLRLEAELQGETVHLKVIDDGGGVDAARLWQKAQAAGIVHGDEDPSQRSLLELLVHPGLSTREEVDEMAGRGIGMDIVEAAVVGLGGDLHLETTPGQGSCFTLSVPTCVTTAQGLILEVGSYRLGVQIEAVERILRVDSDELTLLEGQKIYYHEGTPVAVRSLAELVGVGDAAPDLSQGRHLLLLLRSAHQRLAVVVDDIPGELPMVIKPLGGQFARVRHLTGGAIQADGTVLPVLEHRELFRRASGRQSASFYADRGWTGEVESSPKGAPQQKLVPTILVVDDSVTTRTLERTILEGAGYRVLTAGDGAEALQILERHEEVDLVVTDLEMPQMNGLELCRRLRGGAWAALPIIIVTSRGAEEEIRRGLEVGADAYIVKGQFDQDHFMGTVNRFVG